MLIRFGTRAGRQLLGCRPNTSYEHFSPIFVQSFHFTPGVSRDDLISRTKTNIEKEVKPTNQTNSPVNVKSKTGSESENTNEETENEKIIEFNKQFSDRQMDLKNMLKEKRAEMVEMMEDKRTEMRDQMEEKKIEMRERLEDKKTEFLERLEETKTEMRERLEDKKTEMRERMEDKKTEMLERMEEKKTEMRERMEDKKTEMRERMEDKKTEMRERMEEKKTEMKERIEERRQTVEARSEETRTRIFWKMFNNLFLYLKSYGDILKTAFPDRVVKTYKIFSIGTKSLFSEMKVYSGVHRSIAKNKARDYSQLSRLPKDLVRVTPVLLISALPFAQNIVFPLALLYPRVFLSTHFWNTEQLLEHYRRVAEHQDKLYPVLTTVLYNSVLQIKMGESMLLFLKLLNQINSGETKIASILEIFEIKQYFSSSGPFHIDALPRSHAQLLVSFYNLSYSLFPHRSLSKFGSLLLALDKAIIRDGIAHLSNETLLRLSIQRGLNGIDMKRTGLIEFLTLWTNVSKNVTENELSLLLHLPILISYKFICNSL
ncbi:uncharacterized protein LOC111717518 isoform X2 [Eurytemora carolleeae]|uniref:uncharacterized protein LOC111717518 isoform X2 n=1 Tax=Eurytemora carolleeae TaxID=1294199 RepID=UPI000C76CA93|nr:uncharacterized protein LOC111717518 isoform X2 [Eurytemora carolleeae]|eukprot:XP_023348782.1 uncharacterized protein LOC111717518 isoform X2 [Eurytemora affinis]